MFKKGETMKEDELKEVLRKHKLWLEGKKGGVRCDLRSADLKGADLRGADLEGAYLEGAYLEGADLYNTSILTFSLGKHFAFFMRDT